MPKSLWAVVLVLLVSAFMRLHHVDRAQYRFDEAELSRLALDVASGTEWHTKGLLSSHGLYHPPAMVYIMAVPYIVTHHPIFAVVYIVFLNLVGAAVLQKIALRYFSPTVALVAGLAYAVNPWVLLHTPLILPNSFNTLFLLLGVLLGLYGFLEGRRWAQVLFLPVFLLAPQIHLAGLALIPLVGYFAWVGRRRIYWGAVGVSIVLCLLMLLPFVLGLSAAERRDFTDYLTRRGESEPLQFHHFALERTLHLVSGLKIEHQISKDYYPERLLSAVPRPAALWYGMAALLAVGLAAVWQRRYRRFALFLWVWVGLVVISTSTYRVFPIYHYILLMLPALFLLVAVGVEWLGGLLRPWSYAVYVLPGLIFISQGIWWNNLMNYVDREYVLRYGTPLHYLLEVKEKVTTYDDVVIVGGSSSTSGWGVWHPLLYDYTCVREPLALVSNVLFLPSHPFAVIYPPEAQGATLHPDIRAYYTAGAEHLIPMRAGETPYRVFTFDTPPAWTGTPINLVELPPFENGAQLTGYATSDGQIFLRWSLTPPTGKAYAYQYFVHQLNAQQERIAQLDAGFPAAYYWCSDDQVIVWTPMEILPQTALLRVGMYRFGEDGELINQNVLDSIGNPAGQWIDIPLNP